MPGLPPLTALVAALLVPGVLILVGRLTLERILPMDAHPRPSSAVNLAAGVLGYCAAYIFTPLFSLVTILLVYALGGGWIVLPSHGPGLVLGAIIFALILDLGFYLFHRAEHAVPALWAMHSLHHSDSHYDITTSVRHHWALNPIYLACVSAPIALVFKAPPADLLFWAVINNYAILIHANLNWDFGRGWWLLTSPVFHRTHHSELREHYDSNFAGLFPLWDIVFGTAHRVDRHALPPVGLSDIPEPQTLTDLVLWTQRVAPAE